MEKFRYNADTGEATFVALDEIVSVFGMSFQDANKMSMFIDILVASAKNQTLRDLSEKLYKIADEISC